MVLLVLPVLAAAKPELAVGPYVGQHADLEPGTHAIGLAWGGWARGRWSPRWAVEARVGAQLDGPAGSLGVDYFFGDPSADLVASATVSLGMGPDRAALLAAGGGFDIVLARWLDLRADGRFEVDTDGDTAMLFTVSPVLHTRRSYDADGDGVPDPSDTCVHDAEDRDGHDDIDGCPDPDNDGDGILDPADACADVAEDRDGTLDKDGCPDPDDDEDGVYDIRDGCPSVPEDLDGHEDDDGCPDPDNDGDLVRDEVDRCDDVSEDLDGFEDDDGCPEPDNDGDGVADRWDADPLAPETYNGWMDADGLPDDVPPVLARVLGPLSVRFVTERGAVPTVRAEGDAIGLLGAVLASFPDARVAVTVTGNAGGVEAEAAALGEALRAAGAGERQVELRTEVGAAGVRVELGGG